MIASDLLLLTDVLPEAYLFLDTTGQILAANRRAVRALRGCCDPSEHRLAELVDTPEDQLVSLLRTMSRSRNPVPLPLRWKNECAGELAQWLCEGFLVRPASPERPALLALRCRPGRRLAGEFAALTREVDHQRRALQRLEESRQALEAERERALVTLRSIGDAVITTDTKGHVDFLNPIAEALTGWKSDEAKGRRLDEVFVIVHELTRRPAEDPVARCLREGHIVGLANHTALIAKDGIEYVIEDSAAPIVSTAGRMLGAVLVFRDVTGDRLARRQLEYLAGHDTLTGLFNRRHFEEQVERAVQVARRGEIAYALLFIDLDQFKIVNDSAGHGAGDQLLTEVATAFAARTRESDLLARLGGDEFGVLLTNVGQSEALRIAEKFVQALAGFRFSWRDLHWDITASVGAATIDAETGTAAEAMRRADIACYVAKNGGRHRARLYDAADEAHVSALGEMKVLQAVRDALSDHRFSLYFQPIVECESRRAAMHEVLLRLPIGGGQVITPTAFIAVAERFGLMPEIDRWVVSQALAILEGYPDELRPTLSINLSGASLGDARLLGVIEAAIRKQPALSKSVVFEVTETAAVSALDRAIDFMNALRRFGCRFALDDFGTGFSSLAYLKHLPIDFVKIDGAFVRDIVQDPVDQAMVRSIHHIAHSLGKRTIAEFVESETILEVLVGFGVDYVQGYHIGSPGPHIAREGPEAPAG